MSSNAKSVKSAAVAAEAAEAVYPVVDLLSQGLRRSVELQKSALDSAARQNAEAIAAVKKAFQLVPGAPGVFVFDLAAQAFETYVDTQNAALDLVVEQSTAIVGSTKLGGELVSKAAADVASILQQSVESGLAAERTALDAAVQQGKAVADTLKQNLSGTPAAAIVDSFQRSADVLIDTQKEFLEIASKSFKAAAGKA